MAGSRLAMRLQELGLPCDAAVRHPANGGATAFRSGLARLGLQGDGSA